MHFLLLLVSVVAGCFLVGLAVGLILGRAACRAMHRGGLGRPEDEGC